MTSSGLDITTGIVPMVGRALLRRCPRCGSHQAWFTSWFRQTDRCADCGLARTRNTVGHELGSMTIALVINIGLVVVVMVVAIVLTVPDVPVLTLYLVLAATSVVIPVVTWPITHTLWMAIDLWVRPVDSEEQAAAARFRDGSATARG